MHFNKRRDQDVARRSNFIDYSKRYASLVGAILRETSVEEEFDPASPAQRDLAVQFFMLLSEEHHLVRAGLIDASMGEVWKDGVAEAMKRRFFSTAWRYASSNFDLEGDFSKEWIPAVAGRDSK